MSRLSVATACGLILIALPAAAQDRGPDTPTIVVIGRGQAEQAPDTFRIQADTEATGATQVEALRALSALQSELSRDLPRLQGLQMARLTSAAPGVSPVYDQTCAAGRNYDRQGCPITGYTARMGVVFEGAPADRAGMAVSLASERGATNVRLEGVFLSSDREVLARARQAAFDDARRQAELLAEASGQRLGRILRLQDTQTSAPPAAPARPEVILANVPVLPGVPLDFTPSPVRVNTALTVIFELQ